MINLIINMDKKKIFGKLGKIKGGKTYEESIYTLILG